MNKHFYLTVCVVSIVAVSVVGICTTNLNAIVSFGFIIQICISGLILCEFQRQQFYSKKCKKEMFEKFHEIKHEISMERKMREFNSRSTYESLCSISSLMNLIPKHKKEDDKEGKSEKEPKE